MQSIKFSHDWNKKLTGNNEILTTIRNYDSLKEEYYCKQLGNIFSVELNNKKVCEAKLVTIFICPLIEIPIPFLMVDTGLTKEEEIYELFSKFKCFKYKKVFILLFKKIGPVALTE
jgi:hypothetical protein